MARVGCTARHNEEDRKSVVEGKRVDLGGGRSIKKKEGIGDVAVTGVQTCALPICEATDRSEACASWAERWPGWGALPGTTRTGRCREQEALAPFLRRRPADLPSCLPARPWECPRPRRPRRRRPGSAAELRRQESCRRACRDASQKRSGQ